MTSLRKRMIEDLQLRGSERTQEMYVRAVRQLAEHYRRPPDQLTEEDLRNYFLHLKNVKKYSHSASTIALCGIKFLYDHPQAPLAHPDFRPSPPREKAARDPREEVRKILKHARLPRYRVCLATIYSCGLRLGEGTRLQPELPLVQEPPLPQVPEPPDHGLDPKAIRIALAGPLLPASLHLAPGTQAAGPRSSIMRLRHPLPHLRRLTEKTGPRPQTAGRGAGHGRGSAQGVEPRLCPNQAMVSPYCA